MVLLGMAAWSRVEVLGCSPFRPSTSDMDTGLLLGWARAKPFELPQLHHEGIYFKNKLVITLH